MMKILLFSLRLQTDVDTVRTVLTGAGYDCVVCESLTALREDGHLVAADLLVLDAMRSQEDAIDAIHAAKTLTGKTLPVLMLIDPAALSAEELIGLQTDNADDFLILPVRRSDLLTRVEVLLRLAWPEKMGAAQFRVGPYAFDTLSGVLRRDGQLVELAQKEFDLALLFFHHLNQPLSRATLLETLWGRDANTPSRTVDTHVSRVRNKLRLRDDGLFRLVPVYGFGYVLEAAGREA